MRMWMIPARLLCRFHLLGEHGEIHKHMPSFYRGFSVAGRFSPIVQIQLNALQWRHDELAQEIDYRAQSTRSGGHRSPLVVDLPLIKQHYPKYYDIKVDVSVALADLMSRCADCRERIFSEFGVKPISEIAQAISEKSLTNPENSRRIHTSITYSTFHQSQGETQ